jgi:hypothetical protein
VLADAGSIPAVSTTNTKKNRPVGGFFSSVPTDGGNRTRVCVGFAANSSSMLDAEEATDACKRSFAEHYWTPLERLALGATLSDSPDSVDMRLSVFHTLNI